MKKLTWCSAIAVFCLLGSSAGHAFSLGNLTNQEAAGGLKQALIQGAGHAVDLLGRQNGFLDNPRVKIPLPKGVDKAAGLMRSLGMGKSVDELETAMNRAAEAAVPEARKLLVDAASKMTVQDAKTILSGPDDAATQYFRKTTAEPLLAKFKPIVKTAMAKTQLAAKYNTFASKASQFGVIGQEDAELDSYVTRKALDGLFLMVADEEKAIRQNPAAAAGNLAKKVFGLLK